MSDRYRGRGRFGLAGLINKYEADNADVCARDAVEASYTPIAGTVNRQDPQWWRPLSYLKNMDTPPLTPLSWEPNA